MSASFIISAKDPSGTASPINFEIDQHHFNIKLTERWKDAQIERVDSALLGWSVKYKDGVPSLYGTVFADFVTFIGLQKSDIVEFAWWFRSLIPQKSPLFLYLEGYHDSIELRSDISLEELDQQISVKRFW